MVVVENVWQFPQIKIDFLWKVAIPMSLVKDGNSELIIRQTTPLKIMVENRQFLKKPRAMFKFVSLMRKKLMIKMTHSMQI